MYPHTVYKYPITPITKNYSVQDQRNGSVDKGTLPRHPELVPQMGAHTVEGEN